MTLKKATRKHTAWQSHDPPLRIDRRAGLCVICRRHRATEVDLCCAQCSSTSRGKKKAS